MKFLKKYEVWKTKLKEKECVLPFLEWALEPTVTVQEENHPSETCFDGTVFQDAIRNFQLS